MNPETQAPAADQTAPAIYEPPIIVDGLLVSADGEIVGYATDEGEYRTAAEQIEPTEKEATNLLRRLQRRDAIAAGAIAERELALHGIRRLEDAALEAIRLQPDHIEMTAIAQRAEAIAHKAMREREFLLANFGELLKRYALNATKGMKQRYVDSPFGRIGLRKKPAKLELPEAIDPTVLARTGRLHWLKGTLSKSAIKADAEEMDDLTLEGYGIARVPAYDEVYVETGIEPPALAKPVATAGKVEE